MGYPVAASQERGCHFLTFQLLSKKGNHVKYEYFVQGAPLTLNEVLLIPWGTHSQTNKSVDPDADNL